MKNFRIIPKSVIDLRNRNQDSFDVSFDCLIFILFVIAFTAGWTKIINPYLSSFLSLGISIILILDVSGKFSIFEGLADYQTKRDGQIAVIYGAFISSLGILQFTPAPYFLLEPTGTYGLAVLFGASFVFAGIYIIISTPILEPTTDIVEESYPEVVTQTLARTSEQNRYHLERAWGKKMPSNKSELPPISMKPEVVKMTKVPLVHQFSAYKPVKSLSAQDIIRQIEIDSDWLADDGEYICVQVGRGSIAGVNLANNKPFQLVTSQKVLVLAGQELHCGTIRLNEGIISFDANGKVQQIQASQILGSIDWILPA